MNAWERALLTFLSSEEDETSNAADGLLNEAGQMQHRLAGAYHTIGMRHLAIGNKWEAEENLRNSFEKTAASYWPLPFWSLALAEQLKSEQAE